MNVDDATHRLLDDLFESIDAMDAGRFVHFLTEDARFRFGSAQEVQGREEIRSAVDAFFASIAGCKHKLLKILADEGTVVCEGEVTYTRHDKSEITLPFTNVFEFEGEYISHYKIYADSGPLYAEE